MSKLTFLLSLFISAFCIAQPVKHVKWKTQFISSDKNSGEILITAEIEKGWHAYSQKPTEGPIPTSFKFTPSSAYELLGNTAESESREVHDKTFDAKVYMFDDKAEFRQKIKLNGAARIEITVEYMVCNDSMCVMEGPVKLSVHAP